MLPKGERFRHVLNFLRSGCLHVSAHDDALCSALLDEADFFGLSSMSNALSNILQLRDDQKVQEATKEHERYQEQQMNEAQLNRTLSAVLNATRVKLPADKTAATTSANIAASVGGLLPQSVFNNLRSPINQRRAANDTSRGTWNHTSAPPVSPTIRMSPSNFAADADF